MNLLHQDSIRSLIQKHRSVVVSAFIFLQLSLGISYSFPTLIPHLVNDYGWRAAVSQRVWSCIILVVGIFPIFASISLRRYTYRFLTTMTSIFMFLGFTICSFNQGTDVWLVTIGMGLFVSAAIGFSYIVALRVSMSYFPEAKGLITGVSVGTFGAGSLVWSAIAEQLIKTNEPGFVFSVFSFTAPITIFLTGLFMVPNIEPVTSSPTPITSSSTEVRRFSSNLDVINEEEIDQKVGEKSNPNPNPSSHSASRKGSVLELDLLPSSRRSSMVRSISVLSDLSELAVDTGGVEVEVDEEVEKKRAILSISDVLKQTLFWKSFIVMIFGTSVGFMFLGSLRLFPIERLSNQGYSDDEIQLYTFLATSIAFNIGNGIGRVILGRIVDVFGAAVTMNIVLASLSILILSFVWLAAYPATLVICAFLISSLYGSMYVTMPVCLVDIWGQENFSTVFPWIFLSSGIAGLVGPNLYAVFDDFNLGHLAFVIMSGLLAIAFVTSFSIRKACSGKKEE
ncbi:hypothetical protein P9112_005187 [Eukaryota sp. TZLM1-RC]